MCVRPSYYLSLTRTRRSLATLMCLAVLGSACSSNSETTTSPTAGGRCGMTLATAPSTVDANGGSGQVNITVDRDCTWDARADADWIRLTPPTSGQGQGTLQFTTTANSTVSSRRGAVVVNDQRVEVVQAAPACSFALGAPNGEVPAAGGSLTVSVTALSGCAWTAATQADWIQITQGREGSGNGVVSIAVAANGGAAREAAVLIGGQTYTVTQPAGSTSPPNPSPQPPQPGCQLNATPTSASYDNAGGDGTVTVTASSSSCVWAAASSVPWITMVTTAGNGNGTARYMVAANTGPARTGTLSVAGTTVTVTQAAASLTSCTFDASPRTPSVDTAGGEVTIRVTTSAPSCAWTATSGVPWVTVAAGSGTGEGNARFTAAANTGAARTGTLTVAGIAITLTQSAAAASSCTFALSPTSQSVAAAGVDEHVNVNASADSCVWTAVSNAPWITITAGSSRTGDGDVRYTVAANTGAARTGTMTIAGTPFTVTQSAPAPCTFTVNPTSESFTNTAGNGTVSVNASTSSCAWTATTTASWITVTTGAGTGDGTARYSVAANTGAARTATLTVAGVPVSISQAAAPPLSIEVSGAVSGLAGSCPALTFTVSGRLIHTTAATVFGSRCDRIRNGDNVSVTGVIQPDNSMLALTVREN